MSSGEPEKTCRACGNDYPQSRSACPHCGRMPRPAVSPFATANPMFFLVQGLALFAAWTAFAIATPSAVYQRYSWVFFNLSQGVSLGIGIAGTVIFLVVIAGFTVSKKRIAETAAQAGEKARSKRRADRGPSTKGPGAPPQPARDEPGGGDQGTVQGGGDAI